MASAVTSGRRAWAVHGRTSSQHLSSTETEDPLSLNWQRVNLIVKILQGSTCSYPSTVQGARGLGGQLAST